ncbi:MAG: hypothetical protein MRJ68_17910 [Nitrospira sp.]|nr:hypothetical protein [Nitrospira sp.]
MQSLADQVKAQLVEDLQAAGYAIIPHDTYKDLPAYRSLIDLGGNKSPASITLKFGDPEKLAHGEALAFAPIGLGWYSPSLGEVGSRIGDAIQSVGSGTRLSRHVLIEEHADSQVEVALDHALNARLLTVYYIVSSAPSFSGPPGERAKVEKWSGVAF